MSSHFLPTAKTWTLSLSAVLRMTDQEAEDSFRGIRWHATDGKPVSPLRLRDRMGLPEGQRRAALEMQGIPQMLLGHVGDLIRVPQDAAVQLPRGHGDLLQ